LGYSGFGVKLNSSALSGSSPNEDGS